MLRVATEPERARILGALPAASHTPRFRGGVASVLVEEGGEVLDGAVRLVDPLEVWIRPLVPRDAAGLDACLSLLERRRAKTAHDASGPATGVLAAIETVLEYEPIPDSTRTLLEDSRDGLLRLTKLLTDRADSLSQQPNVVAGSLGSVLARLAQPSVEGLGRVRVTVRATDVDVRVDASIVEGVLATLLSNAWSCRRGQEASAEIEGDVEGGVLRISVADQGRGIDDETMLRAGQLGYALRPSGVGVGLFQVRRALARRGGALVIQAAPQGARATVLLPLNAPAVER